MEPKPIRDPSELQAPELWESDEELERFLEETYRARRKEEADEHR